jgi:DNA-binding transcriptional ArsR family regulator
VPVTVRDKDAAVKAYLDYLNDPGSALNQDAITAAERAVAAATDVVEKVLALTRLEQVAEVDEETLRAGFVANVAAWCKRKGATGSALATFGVPVEVLVEARVLTPASRDTAGNGAREKQPRPNPVAPARVDSLDEVVQLVPVGKDFRAAEFAAIIGRNISTARSHLSRLRARGVVEEVGPDPNWASRGAPPILYRRVGGEGGI